MRRSRKRWRCAVCRAAKKPKRRDELSPRSKTDGATWPRTQLFSADATSDNPTTSFSSRYPARSTSSSPISIQVFVLLCVDNLCLIWYIIDRMQPNRFHGQSPPSFRMEITIRRLRSRRQRSARYCRPGPDE